MSTPFFSDPLLFTGAGALLAQAGYYALHWTLGGREGKARAAEGFERVLVSAVLFAVAMSFFAFAALGLSVFLELMSPDAADRLYITKELVESLKNSSYAGYGEAAAEALKRSEAVYHKYFDVSVATLASFFGAVTGLGLLPWTQSVSMGIMNAMGAAVMTASTVLVSSAVYAVAAAMARGWVLLMPLGAVLVTYERTRNLGALLLAVSVAAPLVLAVGADVAYASAPPRAITFEILGNPAAVYDVAKSVVYLGLIAVTLAALTYAVSRLFDHAGAHFAID